MSLTADPTKSQKAMDQKHNSYPFWSPRFWHGMRLRSYLGLMWRNGWRVHPFRWPMALLLLPITIFNSVLYRFQQLFYGRQIKESQCTEPPIFIVGHWRSGTTHLHELLVCDDRLAYPTTYECFAPYHFLVTEWILPRLLWFLLPQKRPMDNMSAGFDHPQEDEFAICAMGAPTPYYRMAFPNRPPPYPELLDMDQVDPKVLNNFKEALSYFVKALTVKKQKRLVMKSPPHTGRIEVLAEMFPDARFIHISRNPYSIFPSTRRTWQALDAAQGFQIPRHDELDEYVFDCFERMYRGFEHQREHIDPSRICDVRYEDLVQDPIGEVQALYEKLQLGDFDHVRPKLEKYLERQKNYRPNRHQLEPKIKETIDRRWASYFDKYGYERDGRA